MQCRVKVTIVRERREAFWKINQTANISDFQTSNSSKVNTNGIGCPVSGTLLHWPQKRNAKVKYERNMLISSRRHRQMREPPSRRHHPGLMAGHDSKGKHERCEPVRVMDAVSQKVATHFATRAQNFFMVCMSLKVLPKTDSPINSQSAFFSPSLSLKLPL